MLALILFLIASIATLAVISFLTRTEEKERIRRQSQRKMKIQAESMIEIINCLEQITPTRMIPKLINDEVINLLTAISQLDKSPPPHLLSTIERAQLRSKELMNSQNKTKISYHKESDSQIKYAQFQLGEGVKVLRQLHTKSIITDSELSTYESELSWASLMVGLASQIAQGQEFAALGDNSTAQEYFKKAQQILLQSVHQDSRRQSMIKELDEMIAGTRRAMSKHLLSEQSSLAPAAAF